MEKLIVIKFIGPMKKPEGKSSLEKKFSGNSTLLQIMKELKYSDEELSFFSFAANNKQIETGYYPNDGDIIIVSMPLGGG